MASRQNSTQKLSKAASVDKITSQTQNMSTNDEHKQDLAGCKTGKRAGSVSEPAPASPRQDSTVGASDLKVPKDAKKEKRRSIAEIQEDEEKCLEWVINEEYLKELDKEAKPEEKQRRREESEKLKVEGNDVYKKGEFLVAARVYTTALRLLPFSYGNERAILYSNRAACFMYMDEMDEGILDCSKALEINPNYIKAIVRRAQLYEKMEKLDEALTDYRKVLEMEPKNPKALEACTRLPDEIRDRNDKVKTEMLGKLKDLGNMILKPFGMSTDNFKVQQDPSTGSYSINLQQNK